MKNKRRVVSGVICAMAFLLVTGDAARAELQSLAARLPRGANAVMAIDVAKLIQSPLGQKMELQSKLVSGYADRPLAVPATARRLAIAAAVHPTGMRSIWQAAVIELSTAPRFEPMLRAQGGFLDKIEGRNTAWTPRDTFYIQLDDHTMGVLRPAQRQFARRWVSAKAADTGLSPYLGNALTAAGDAHAVFAVDLDDVVGMAALRYALGMGQLAALEKIETGQDKLLAALATVKGMKIVMRATDHIDAEWTIDFDQDVSTLGAEAKPFIIDVLTAADLYEGNAERWEFKAQGKQIIGKGTMEPEGMNRLLALLSPAHVGEVEEATAESSGAPGEEARPAAQPAPADAKATASQQYYRAVSKILDSAAVKPSPKQGASWLIAQSRQIQQLPAVNVDPALMQWGNQVSDAFNRAAQELAIGQQRATVAAQGVQSPTASVSYTESGQGSSDSPESRAAFRNAQQQRRQAAQSERGQAAERAFAILNEVLPTRGQIRIDMVQKYGVEF